jgi:hypothetical protein
MLGQNWPLIGYVLGAWKIDYPLREAQRFGSSVRSHSAAMGAAYIPHTAVLFVDNV